MKQKIIIRIHAYKLIRHRSSEHVAALKTHLAAQTWKFINTHVALRLKKKSTAKNHKETKRTGKTMVNKGNSKASKKKKSIISKNRIEHRIKCAENKCKIYRN